MISRRRLLLASASMLLMPGKVLAAGNVSRDRLISWTVFQIEMEKLADAEATGMVNQQVLVKHGQQLLKQLDIRSASFRKAVDESYESGNRYWLWQRLLKAENVNGGIINIDNKQIVQLHDHPGATGMVRIISGEVEAWQFDEVKQAAGAEPGVAELTRVSRHILRPGDTAVLTPDKGNIHALRSISKESRMLDFFIPPYKRSQRNWFEPLNENWFDMEKVTCRKIPQHVYTKA